MFTNSNTNKRYYTLDYYYKNKYKSKVFKVSLNIGCSCPNIDGTKSNKGCIYCLHKSGDFAGNIKDPIKKQFNDIKNIMLKKWPNAKYIAYFQAGSNTYGDINKLKKNFYEVLKYKNVVGINIATRCDCINDEVLNLLKDLNNKTDLVVELGLQTIHNKTLKLINCCYKLKDFKKTYKLLTKNNIKVVVHIINGLPYETKKDMIKTVKYLNKLNIFGIKIHMLHILKSTELEKIYKKEKFHILTKEEYVDIVVSQLEYLNENIIINRITGDPNTKYLIEPKWLIKKFCVINEIDKLMVKKNTYQGIKTKKRH